MATVKVTISLPKAIAHFIDELAAKEERPRSAVIAGLLEERRRQLFEAELAQAYIETAEDSLRFAEEGIWLDWEVISKYSPYDWPEEK